MAVSYSPGNIRKIFWNLRIQSKLIISFSTAFAVSIVTVICIFYSSWVPSLRQEAVNYSSLYIKQLNENINAYFNELDRLALMTQADNSLQKILGKNISGETDFDLKDDSDYVENFLFNIYTLKPDITNIVLISENGMLFTEGIRRYSLFNENPGDYQWYREAAVKPGKSMIFKNLASEDRLGLNNDEPGISVVRMITDVNNNRMLGCIRIDVSYKKVQSIIERVGRTGSMEIIIMDNDYNVIFDPYSVLKIINIPRFAEVFEKIIVEKDGNVRAPLGSNSRTIVFNHSDYTGWTTLGIIIDKKLLKDTWEVRNLSILIAVITIFIIVLICAFIAMGITRPLKKLRESMKMVAGGNFNIKVDFDCMDEIGDIGRSFDKMTFKINELIKKEYLLEIKRKEAELKALQAQINPHFLYNTLESLRMKAVVNQDREVADMAKKLSRFLQLNIIGDNEIVKISEELSHVVYYMDIQNIRYNNRYEYIIDFDEELMNASILKLTFQPLIENALFHGLEPKDGYCVIILRGRKAENEILIEIIDNGMGMDEERLDEIKTALAASSASDKLGIGMVNVHKRLKFHFGEKYGLEISSTMQKGTKIEIHIPMIINTSEGGKDAQATAG